MLDHRDITDDIRTPQISMLASAVSARSVVRKFLLDTQRRIGLKKNIVVEGRDMGTVVFPDADVKFFLDAAVHTRARRRYLELQENDATSSDLESVERDMMRRDNNDANRTIAPLRAAADAIVIDSTKLNVEQVIQIMLDHITA
jgi:cytidylate kinase